MKILGIYGGFDWDANKSFDSSGDITWVHDSGSTLFIDGHHICSISEERLTRIKNDGNFPINSIKYCLNEGNIDYLDVEEVYIPSMCIEIFYRQSVDGTIKNKIKNLFPKAKINIISHHLSHAASSVFSSNFNDGSIVTIDGSGSLIYYSDFKNVIAKETNTIGYFNKEKNIFRIFNGLNKTNNFGEYYNYCSHKIYCDKIKKNISLSDEKYRETWGGKIMGLSAYGATEKNKKINGYTTSKDLLYKNFPYVILDHDNKNYALKNADEQAYTLQKNFENALIYYFSELKKSNYLEENICLSGGTFLNVLGNSCLKKLNLNIHVPPYPSDVGLHFGAACFGAFQNKEKINLPNNIALLGKKYSQIQVEQELKKFNLNYKKYENFEELCKFTAQKLNENKIIGWFQNKSEFGPRALGSRSLLMHPGPAKNKDIMNSRVKHREYWRPFAGIVLKEYLNAYFEEDFCSPYMLYSLTVKEDKRDEIAAITHVDNTCRVQTVTKELHPEITLLIQKFKEVSGIPVILNTSFNDNGEPIIETPGDAIKAFNNLDIDYLVINNFLIKKKKFKKNNILYS